MSRIPPSLLYLTIYNPTLKPATLHADDDEDAEELAHILFHTAREHAVSRDRILRQVGLAKALVNFSEMFNAGVPCENVHSQARRMIMLSPEPNFWIHACYEVARTPKPPPAAHKSKDNPKNKSKGKGKEKEHTPKPVVQYDYHDGSVHDEALRAHFQRGYEGFKLLHGSFTSVLSTLGQEALELQLERFFTIWAWKWDVDDEDFGQHLGIPLHPLHHKLTPLLETFTSQLPEGLLALGLIPPYVIPPRESRYPAALVRYVLSRIPPPPPIPASRNPSPGPPASSTSTPLSSIVPTPAKLPGPKSGGQEDASAVATNLLTMPTMQSMTMGLDMKSLKWSWPGYLTFGKSGASSKAPSIPATPPTVPVTNPEPTSDHKKDDAGALEDGLLKPDGGPGKKKEAPDVDTASLLEAISTESMGSYSRAASPSPSALSRSTQLGEESSSQNAAGSDAADSPVQGNGDAADVVPTVTSLDPSANDPAPRVVRSFLRSAVYLASSTDPLATEKKRVLHLTEDGCTVAIVTDMEHTLDLARLADDTVELIESIHKVLAGEKSQSKEAQIPSATKILQPQDKYIVAKDDYTTTSSTTFVSRSEHLYNAQELLRSDHDILEVFSRGQNPQHWYIGKRGLGNAADGSTVDGEAYMEVSRKETTLTDVDNGLAGVVRRFIEQLS